MNPGIYVSDEYYGNVEDLKEYDDDKNDVIAREMSKLFDFTVPKVNKDSKWYHIGTVEDLEKLIEKLDNRGVREHELLTNLSYWKIDAGKQLQHHKEATIVMRKGTEAVVISRELLTLLKHFLNHHLFCASADMDDNLLKLTNANDEIMNFDKLVS